MDFLDASVPAAEMRTQSGLELWMKAISAILRTVSAGSLREQRAVYSLHEPSLGQWRKRWGWNWASGWSPSREKILSRILLWPKKDHFNNFDHHNCYTKDIRVYLVFLLSHPLLGGIPVEGPEDWSSCMIHLRRSETLEGDTLLLIQPLLSCLLL